MKMSKRDRKKFNQLRVEFLPEALEIVEKPTAPLGNLVIWLVFVLLLIFVLWACFGKVDEVAVARGQVMSDDGAQEIQSAGTGIITEVKVKEGQSVKKGNLLYTMDKEVEKINIEYSEGEIGLTQLKAELLNELLAGKDITEYRKGNYSAEQVEVIEAMITFSESGELSVEEYEIAVQNAENQYALAENAVVNSQEKGEYLEEQRDIQERSQKLENTGNVELELLKSQYEYAANEAEKYKKLYDAGAKAKSEWDAKVQEVKNIEKQIEIKEIEVQSIDLTKKGDKSTMEYQLNENSAEYTAQQGALEESENNYNAAVLNLENARKQRESALYEQKEQCDAKLKEYGITVKQQYYEYENKDIYAPYDGVVKTLFVGKEGAVVSATQVVAEILPDTAQLIVEAEVSNQDIGFVEVGQDVDIKIDTYDYQKYGTLTGSVMYISPDAIKNEKMEQIYKVNILLDAESADNLDLTQGMQCSAEIKTDRRRIIEFFLEPLTEALNNSLRER